MRSPESPAPSSSSDAVTGQIERVTFHSDESGFCVVKVSVRGRKDLCTVVGTVPSVSVGEWLSATGQWTIDPRHGPQFKADQIRTSAPESAEGIERYLASGLIKGIGPAYAGRLVARFGKDVFTVIAERPARLREVEGIGRERQRAITESFRAQKVVREIMVFLHSHGVSSSRAYRIFKTYGEEAIAKVQADPYCLARDIRGIGFKTADEIAAKLGVAARSELRARAGVEYTLQELTRDGHCAYPRADLARKVSELLGVPADLADAAITHGVASRRLAEHPGPEGSPLVYLAPLDDAERDLARGLARLFRGRHPLPPVDAGKAADWVESKVGLELSATQRAALAKALTSKVMVITGGPGVGKTTLVDSIVRIFRAKKLSVVLCAPTGRAAKRLSETSGLEAKTIHRLLEFDPATLAFKHDAARPLQGDLFVVDEASMLDVVLCRDLVRAIPASAALLFVGDVDQLPSVGPGSVLRDVIESGTIPVLRLTEVFRQAAQSAIVGNAHRINRGVLPALPEGEPGGAGGTDFHFVEAEDAEEGVARILRLVTEVLPRRFRFNAREDVQVLCPMQKGELGARNLNVRLQQALNPSGESIERFGWTFRVGDRVMQTVNDYEKNVFNGDIGRIRQIDSAEQELTVAFDGRPVEYEFGELDELTLAYAATVHKSQGSEYPAVVVPIHGQHYVMLQRNLLYTAVTRARKLVVLVGTKSALAIAVNRVSSRRRITTLKERLAAAASREGSPSVSTAGS
jgi:exodeoxyribonuclease V alpha subunit